MCLWHILGNKWRILHQTLDVVIELADYIIKTFCILHNFLRKMYGYSFEDTLLCDLNSVTPVVVRGTTNGINERNMFNCKERFNSWKKSTCRKDYCIIATVNIIITSVVLILKYL